MPPGHDDAPAAPPSPTTPHSGRRLLSRIASPFTSKARNLTDFYIDVSDPHRQYSPGDLVAGSVCLRLSKPIRVTHLVVCLHGFVQVFKTPGSPGEGYRANAQYWANGRPKNNSGEYFGNGFASLFEDEVVLCGDGRLAEGAYQFNFELEFPDRDLPSSIDFERGTISYMITATLTRPTPIAPTLTCDRKVYFVESIDISPLVPPRSRTITLEPLQKRSRTRSQARLFGESSRKTDSQPKSEDARRSQASTAQETPGERESPGSPSPSEISFESLASSAGRRSHSDAHRPSVGTSEHSKASTTTSKIITATVELMSGGCLRGDAVPIKVNVGHTKAVKSVYGVIVTLYRQARVDMHPAIPLGPIEKGTAAKYEDYYPKSLTGLGGLSLSGAGSSHNFRKDLTQTLAPLYINPHTLAVEVNTRIRIPDSAFPTISTVPGGMISFKYYIEVVLDIQGKLGSQDRNLGNLGGLATTQGNSHALGNGESERNSAMPFGPPIIDTAQLRRDKGVVCCTFEIVVGTRDNARRKGKRKVEIVPEIEEAPIEEEANGYGAPDEHEQDHEWHDDPDAYHEHYWQQPYTDYSMASPDAEYAYGYMDAGNGGNERLPTAVPIPQLPDESQMTEKERIRRHEERLLPSQPPTSDTADWSANDLSDEPSAPYLAEESSYMFAGMSPSAPAYDASMSPVEHGQNGFASSSASGVPSYEASMPIPVLPEYPTSQPEHGHDVHQGSAETERVIITAATALDTRATQTAEAPPDDDKSITIPTASASNGPERAMHDSHADALPSANLPRYEQRS